MHSTGVTLFLRNESIASEDNVAITDIGEGNDSLVCETNQTDCCNDSQIEWLYPDGTMVNSSIETFYTQTNLRGQILLNRRNALKPLGSYCCNVDTYNGSTAIICINLSKSPKLHNVH